MFDQLLHFIRYMMYPLPVGPASNAIDFGLLTVHVLNVHRAHL
jgi:hypothetical protein